MRISTIVNQRRFERLLVILKREPNDSFFDLFIKQIEVISRSIDALNDLIESLDSIKPEEVKERAAFIKKLEEEGDNVRHQIADNTDHTYITPETLDAEDISALAESLDNIEDMIEKAASRLRIYKIKSSSHRLKEQVALVKSMVKNLEDLLRDLPRALVKKDKRLRDSCLPIHSQEEGMDHLYRSTLEELSGCDSDEVQEIVYGIAKSIKGIMEQRDEKEIDEIIQKIVHEMIKGVMEALNRKEIYEIMEKVTDRCHDAVMVLERILSKNRIGLSISKK